MPAGGDILDGRFVPAGTWIGHSVFSMMRNKAVFGEDVDVFRPERWLDASPQGRARMHHTAALGFGSGRWSCAGKTVALIQLNKIFVEVRSFPAAHAAGFACFFACVGVGLRRALANVTTRSYCGGLTFNSSTRSRPWRM